MKRFGLLFMGLFSCLSVDAADAAFSVSKPQKVDSTVGVSVWYDVKNNGSSPIKLSVSAKDKSTSQDAGEDFNIHGNGVYILPNKTERIKVTYYGDVDVKQGQYDILFKVGSTVKKMDLFTSDKPASISLKGISVDRNGMYKAEIQK